VKGSTPRGWYYLLRELDPNANRYDAIVIGLDDYDDNDDYSRGESPSEVEMPVFSLHIWDVFDYPWTFRAPNYRRDAFWECILKGSAYKRDFQELLSHPFLRWRSAKKTRHDYAWFVAHYIGADWSLAGTHVDWNSRQIEFPNITDPTTRDVLQKRIRSSPEEKDEGWKADIRREWIGRIAEHYHSSHTLLIFLRLPSSPIPTPPSMRPVPLRGVVRDLATRLPNIALLNEHAFDYLERPENFYDYTHLNAVGARALTEKLVPQIEALLTSATRE